jgi:hypothetical protein
MDHMPAARRCRRADVVVILTDGESLSGFVHLVVDVRRVGFREWVPFAAGCAFDFARQALAILDLFRAIVADVHPLVDLFRAQFLSPWVDLPGALDRLNSIKSGKNAELVTLAGRDQISWIAFLTHRFPFIRKTPTAISPPQNNQFVSLAASVVAIVGGTPSGAPAPGSDTPTVGTGIVEPPTVGIGIAGETVENTGPVVSIVGNETL